MLIVTQFTLLLFTISLFNWLLPTTELRNFFHQNPRVTAFSSAFEIIIIVLVTVGLNFINNQFLESEIIIQSICVPIIVLYFNSVMTYRSAGTYLNGITLIYTYHNFKNLRSHALSLNSGSYWIGVVGSICLPCLFILGNYIKLETLLIIYGTFIVSVITVSLLRRISTEINTISTIISEASALSYFRYLVFYQTGPFSSLLVEPFLYRKNELQSYLKPKRISTTAKDQVAKIKKTEAVSIKSKNYILMIIDSMRQDLVWNSESSPFITSIAKKSLVFTNTYSLATHTNYVDPFIYSSQYPLYALKPVYHKKGRKKGISIHEFLKAEGYKTALFSSQDENWCNMIEIIDPNMDILFHAGSNSNMKLRKTGECGKIHDKITLEMAFNWVEKNREEPFFLTLNLQNLHIPYTVDAPKKSGPIGKLMNVSSSEIQQLKDRYYESMNCLDHLIQYFFDRLKSIDLFDRSIIAITADTGQAFYEHGFLAHGRDLFNECVKVPLIIANSGLPPKEVNNLISQIDIIPILLNFQFKIKENLFEGLSLESIVSNYRKHTYFIVQTPMSNQYGISDGQWKLIYDLYANHASLYNLIIDPNERNDVSLNHSDIKLIYQEKLFSWIKNEIVYKNVK